MPEYRPNCPVELDAYGTCQCLFCRANRENSQNHENRIVPPQEAQTFNGVETMPLTNNSPPIMTNTVTPGHETPYIQGTTITATQASIQSTPRGQRLEILENFYSALGYIPYSEERFGPSFAGGLKPKKPQPKIKRVNGVNIIKINFKYRIDSYAKTKNKSTA